MMMCRAAGLGGMGLFEGGVGWAEGDVLDIIGSRDEWCILIGIGLSGEEPRLA